MKYLSSQILTMTLFSLGPVALAQAETLPKYDPNLLIYVKTPDCKDVAVRGPEISYDDVGQSYYEWKVVSSAPSPDGKFSAIHYLGRRPKYWDAHVYLVSPDGFVSELSNSTVRSVQWTEDSKYLLGFGDNTLRVWNMSGGRRQMSLGQVDRYYYSDGLLCINHQSYHIDSEGRQAADPVEVYSIPSLKKLISAPYSAVMDCNK